MATVDVKACQCLSGSASHVTVGHVVTSLGTRGRLALVAYWPYLSASLRV